MDIRVKRFDKELSLPGKGSEGAAAFDLTAREEVAIAAGAIGYVPLNVVVEIPADHFLLIAARSGTHKRGLIMANGIGIIDPDFSGDEDELRAVYYNFTKEAVIIEKGERIAQGIFMPVAQFAWMETGEMGKKSRGGFGSTGKK